MNEDSSEIGYREIRERILQIEEEFDLFNQTISGVNFWSQIRVLVYAEARRQSGLQKATLSLSESRIKKLLQQGGDFTKNSSSYNPHSATSADVLLYSSGRRRKLEDNLWWDRIIDPVVEATDRSTVVLEEPFSGRHRTPVKSETVYYTDYIEKISKYYKKIRSTTYALDNEDEKLLEKIEARFNELLGIQVPLYDLVVNLLLERRICVPSYCKIIEKIDPEVVMINNTSYKNSVVESCKRLDIPTVELQHGMINEHAYTYSYPGNRTHSAFPDFFFAFGELWKDSIEFPISQERVIPVGYPYLETWGEKYKTQGSENYVLFLSQPSIAKELSQIAIELAAENPSINVGYKLHPTVSEDWNTTHPWSSLAGTDVEVLEGSKELYQIFSESIAQVSGWSTAIFEGLYFELDTYIIDHPIVHQMWDSLECEKPTMVSSGESLANHLKSPNSGPKFDIDRFFKPDAAAYINENIELIINSGIL